MLGLFLALRQSTQSLLVLFLLKVFVHDALLEQLRVFFQNLSLELLASLETLVLTFEFAHVLPYVFQFFCLLGEHGQQLDLVTSQGINHLLVFCDRLVYLVVHAG